MTYDSVGCHERLLGHTAEVFRLDLVGRGDNKRRLRQAVGFGSEQYSTTFSYAPSIAV